MCISSRSDMNMIEYVISYEVAKVRRFETESRVANTLGETSAAPPKAARRPWRTPRSPCRTRTEPPLVSAPPRRRCGPMVSVLHGFLRARSDAQKQENDGRTCNVFLHSTPHSRNCQRNLNETVDQWSKPA